MRIQVRAGKMPHEPVSAVRSMRENITGSNVGNMLFQEAVIKALQVPGYQVSRASNRNPDPRQADLINDECDLLVLPLANWFRPSFAERLDHAAELIRRLRVPVVVVGVGCQTDLDYNYDKLMPMAESVKRFTSAVLDKSASIGVRGECTASFLRQLGFNAVDIIGCPSMFMHGPEFREISAIAEFGRNTKISINVSAPHSQAAFSAGLSKVGEMVGRTVGAYGDVEYIPQENGSTKDLLYGRKRHDPEHAVIPADAYNQLYTKGRVVTFVDPRTWCDHLSRRQFVFGTRLHGCIAGLLGGTPSHLIVHDSRTLELARYFDIPYTTTRALDTSEDPSSLYERSSFAEMRYGHVSRFATYTAFLARNGLRNTFDDGDGGVEYDHQLRGAPLAAPVRAPTRFSPVPYVRRLNTKLRRS